MRPTREEILAEPAGRRLDAWVAEHVLGKRAVWIASEPEETRLGEGPLGFTTNFGGRVYTSDGEWLVDDWLDPDANRAVPPYSTDIAAAWGVLEALHARGEVWTLIQRCGLEIFTGDYGRFGWECWARHASACVEAETAPLAICKAALLATHPRDPPKPAAG